MRYIYDLKFGMLQVRENEISPRISSGDIAHLYSCARQKKHWLRYNLFSTNKNKMKKEEKFQRNMYSIITVMCRRNNESWFRLDHN